MFKCTDPVVDYLARFGFNVIRLPRAGLAPGDVLAGKGPGLEHVGPIGGAWKSRRAMPKPLDPVPATMLEGRGTAEFDAGVGLSLLEQLLSPLGVSAPKLKAGLGSARSLSFGFVQPRIWGLELIALGDYLASGSLQDSNPVVAGFFKSDVPIHIITDLLTSSSMEVTVTKNSHAGGDVDLKMLQQAVTGEVSLSSKNADTTTIRFEGKDRLAFGFRAIKALVKDGAWQLMGIPKAGSVFYSSPPPPTAWASKFPPGETVISSPGA